jgi:hypothetical protein
VPPDSVRCTREDRLQTLHLREFSEPARYNSPDCPVYTGQCPVLQEDATPNSAVSGIRFGCSAIIHRTCPVQLRSNGSSAPTVTCRHIKCAPEHALWRAGVRHAHHDAPDTKQWMSGAPPDIKTGPASELQRSEPQRSGDVVGAPDCPVCTGQCPVLQEDAALNSPVSGIRFGCSAIIHRTCPV